MPSLWRYSNRNQGVARDFFDGGSATDPRTQWKKRRDTDAKRLLTLLAEGEPFWVVDDDPGLNNTLWVGDGFTLGGILIGGGIRGGGAITWEIEATFDGETTLFEDALPAVPNPAFPIFIVRTGAPVLFDSDGAAPNVGQFAYSGKNILFGEAPPTGGKAIVTYVPL